MPSGTKLNKASLAALQASRRAYSSRAAWRVASGLTAAFGLLAVMLLIGVFFIAKLSFFPLLMASIIAAAPLVFAALAFRKSKQTQSLIQSSLDRAWLESTKQLAAHQGPIQAETLMQAYGIDADSEPTKRSLPKSPTMDSLRFPFTLLFGLRFPTSRKSRNKSRCLRTHNKNQRTRHLGETASFFQNTTSPRTSRRSRGDPRP